MTTQYIDPQVVFASDAPTQDKPPTFNNYVKGMDETRSNDGRPTIKQLNFLFQQQDFKFLYMHERGACLPFVESFPYENNSIVVKDGIVQQKNGNAWFVPFMRGSQNLAELTDSAQARTKLEVYAKSETLSKTNNLSELTDKAVARTNLGVYSKSETDNIAGTPNATETIAGKAKVATNAISQAGTNDTDFITALKLQQKLNNVSFGINQTLSEQSSIANTWYTNTSGKVMFAHKVQSGTNHSVIITVRINGVTYSFNSGSVGNNFASSISVCAIIPIGAEYSCNYPNLLIFS